MRWLFRPSILVVLSAALVLGAAALVLWPWGGDNQPRPQAVAAGDQEIAWLYAATAASTWERFVTAVQNTASRSDLGLSVDSSQAFPPQTTAVPEVALSVRGCAGRLRIRWYKLTSDWKTEKWVQALSRRQPPPLAIVGGSSSDPAIDLANCLQDQYTAATTPAATPLLLLTTATADEGQRPDSPPVSLTELYDQRTFRFCFTNRQMAEAVTDFIWSQDTLRPDGDPFYVAFWEDDAYSRDLAAQFGNAVEPRLVARNFARFWAWPANPLSLSAPPGRWANLSVLEPIRCSIGTFDQPNHWEAGVTEWIMDEVRAHDSARRSVLVLPAASAQPARRFLRGLMRVAPARAERFVVVTGDAIPFSTIYRDHNVSWPVQDLPFDLVLFCHRNPADARVGFRVEGDTAGAADDSPGGTGTEDVLLFGDLAEALVQTAFRDGGLAASANELAGRLRQANWLPTEGRVGSGPEGFTLFSERGNRHSGTGEHVVWLHPRIDDGRIQPQATISIWSFQPEDSTAPHRNPRPGRSGRWQPSREPLTVDYEMINR
jgi:hypothetical protein